ncbi:hypothetical protein TNCT_253171 [Trichonephila clavata]|uniref:Uncharacterized protein n=1 Tax=Trichonephila clavata TaxID=2740835 RepID=A0A8X6HFK0_TRICU|nr:hypothetical protein TNCT_253171 [Trichonephila clavata]
MRDTWTDARDTSREMQETLRDARDLRDAETPRDGETPRDIHEKDGISEKETLRDVQGDLKRDVREFLKR